KLIDMGDFSRSPLQLPWTSVRITTLNNPHGTLDFEHLLNESFDDVIQYFQNSYKTQKPAVSLSTDVMRYSKVSDLVVRGFEAGPNESKITLGFTDLPRSFFITVERHGNQTKLIVINSTHTKEF